MSNTKGKKPNSDLTGGVKDPFKSTYVNPFDVKEYKDPLRIPKGTYVDPVKARKFEVPEFHPYDTVKEYKLPDIDPLTGKPYRKGRRRPRQVVEEPKKAPTPAQPVPKAYFPSHFGSTVGSTKRMLRIQDHLQF